MFYINEQQNAKIRFGGKGGSSTIPVCASDKVGRSKLTVADSKYFLKAFITY